MVQKPSLKLSNIRGLPLLFLTSNKRSILFWCLILVPLLSAAGIEDKKPAQASTQATRTTGTLPELIYHSSEHFSDIDSANLDGLLERIGDSRLVLLGEASHGTAEFYDMRARITRELIKKKGFTIIAAEAEWPDASIIDHFIRGSGKQPVVRYKAFGDFPAWMWKNQSIITFLRWLKDYNQGAKSPEYTVGFYGLDIYNLFGSVDALLDYLQAVDPAFAKVARWRYSCLMPWSSDPALYSQFMEFQTHHGCESEVNAVLRDLRKKQAFYKQIDAERYFNAEQNARLVINSERYFRTRYQGIYNSWNLRDESMFETLLAILNYRGQTSKAVVWAHNSHIGDARATDRNALGEINLGQRVRETFGDSSYLIGFGTDHGTVAAASQWGGPMEIMRVPPSNKNSYGHLFHNVTADNFLLPLRMHLQEIVYKKLLSAPLQRGIATTYNPEAELKKHYFHTSLPRQFDEYIWFDETQAVRPLSK
jgi:protein-L-isoaspartate(D-aspartate) O-methyltransferase